MHAATVAPIPPPYPAAPPTPDAAAGSPATTASTAATAPRVGAVLAALGAMAAVGAAAAIGSGSLEVTARGSAVLVAPTLGALVLTAPALLAVHQFLGLQAAPDRMVAALSRAVVAGGRVAAGLVPVALFFAVGSRLWWLALAGAVFGVATVMAAVALHELRTAETTALVMPARFALLLLGWTVLVLLIGLRIAASVTAPLLTEVSP